MTFDMDLEVCSRCGGGSHAFAVIGGFIIIVRHNSSRFYYSCYAARNHRLKVVVGVVFISRHKEIGFPLGFLLKKVNKKTGSEPCLLPA